jgi:N-acetylmuramoyl-L-alanine amidase
VTTTTTKKTPPKTTVTTPPKTETPPPAPAKKEPAKSEPAKSEPTTTAAKTDTIASPPKGETLYKIQLFATKSKLATSSKQFKNYKNVGFYQESGFYKYTYGESADLATVKTLLKKVKKDFKDAFIVAFKDGERMKQSVR